MTWTTPNKNTSSASLINKPTATWTTKQKDQSGYAYEDSNFLYEQSDIYYESFGQQIVWTNQTKS